MVRLQFLAFLTLALLPITPGQLLAQRAGPQAPSLVKRSHHPKNKGGNTGRGSSSGGSGGNDDGNGSTGKPTKDPYPCPDPGLDSWLLDMTIPSGCFTRGDNIDISWDIVADSSGDKVVASNAVMFRLECYKAGAGKKGKGVHVVPPFTYDKSTKLTTSVACATNKSASFPLPEIDAPLPIQCGVFTSEYAINGYAKREGTAPPPPGLANGLGFTYAEKC